MEEINDCKEVTLIKDGIITNVERDVMNLGLVVNEYARVNGELLQQNLALRSKVDLALTDKILAFGLSVVGSACLFVNNKTVNWVGVGLLGAGFVFTIR